MKEYYLKIGNQINGPFLLDDLKYQDIQPNTLVRIDKNGDWKHISKDGEHIHFGQGPFPNWDAVISYMKKKI